MNAGGAAAHRPPPGMAHSSPPTMPPPWFLGAPLTKLLALAVLVASAATHTPAGARLFPWRGSGGRRSSSAPSLSVFAGIGQFFAVSTLPELLVGVVPLLCVLARQLEREMGSRRFAGLVVMAAFAASAARAFPFGQREVDEAYGHPPGPYPLLGAAFWFYHRCTPRLHPRFVSLGGLHFSEKSLYYLWFVFAVTRGTSKGASHWKDALVGLAAGALYHRLPPNFQVLPDRWASLAASWSSRFLEAPPPLWVPQFQHQRGGGRGTAGMAAEPSHLATPARRPHHPLAAQAAAAAAAAGTLRPPEPLPLPEADPEAVEQLVGMGFDRDRVVQALREARNDVHLAAERLLSGPH